VLDEIVSWLEKAAGIYSSAVWVSIFFMLIVLIAKVALMRLITRSDNLSMETKRQWAVYLSHLSFIVAAIGLIVIWSNEIRTIALSMAAVAVAIAVSFKEIITCLTSSLLRAVSNSYKLGDHIQIGKYKGRVVDIDMTTTTLMEIGPGNIFQFSGRAVIFPNSLLFSEPLIRLDFTGEYVAHAIEIPVPFGFPVGQGKEILMEIVEEISQRYLAPAKRYMSRMERRHLTDTPSVEPRFAILPVDEKSLRLVARLVVLHADQLEVEQEILFRFMSQVPGLMKSAREDMSFEGLPSDTEDLTAHTG